MYVRVSPGVCAPLKDIDETEGKKCCIIPSTLHCLFMSPVNYVDKT